ncbi:hypothetical protein KI387_009232, partial [Taxus chinensis]
MNPFHSLYGIECRKHLSWDRLEEKVSIGLDLVQDMEQEVILIQQRLQEAQD